MRKYKIATFTGEINDPSSRYRIRQYKQVLKDMNIIVEDYYSKEGRYPPPEKYKRLLWLSKTMTERFKQVNIYKKKDYDITILQREMISTLKTFESFIKKPYIFDVDDSIHLGKRAKNIIDIAKNADSVICGNQYLADFYRQYSDNIYILPTAVDTEIYIPLISNKTNKSNNIVIGWIGTSGNHRFLYKIENALKYILENNRNTKLLIISNLEPEFNVSINYEFINWTEENEIRDIQKIDIGLMPLDYSGMSLGKCSFKMLQYMACGIPVVVTPVGMNIEVMDKGDLGFAAKDFYKEWILYIEELINNEEMRCSMGKEAREVVELNYSLNICAKKLYNIIIDSIENKK